MTGTNHTPAKMALPIAAAMAIAVPLTAAASEVHDGDIGLYLGDDERIGTGHVTDDTTEQQRVFEREFGAEFDNSANIGFDSRAGEFDADSRIGFNFRTALRLWEGEDQGFRFLDPDNEETLQIEYGSTTSATSGSDFEAGFTVGVEDNGEFHTHYWYNLLNATHDDDAIYLLELEKYSTDDALAETYRADEGEFGTSQPFWVLFGHHDEYDHHEMDAALAYTQEHIVPEPGTMGLLALGAGMMFLRRRSRIGDETA